ncbi:hypothetical protein M2189_006714 [Bradyrhizobium japonicum]|uniref:hypothetical protein n=1 Tax=Bradyrhizobium japonicum TaxID=375 RepID=UPI0021676F23|nr:hypothetical protein [Bradyrhizobium japonicum]MCS3503769.1 hypothetical protein [Bradyrhizobium japonicum]MCS3963511.1 hypothetical protein [Bradyrhizobium japonicum]MCS3995824.1 hypothetical protein [Bradyrhizobium japonicum]
MIELPRHVIPKKLASGTLAYYYNVPTKYRALKCPIMNEPLGTDFAKVTSRAKTLNEQFDEWDLARKGLPVSPGPIMPKYGTVDWLFREYKISKAYLEKVADRSKSDYEWAMQQICDIKTKSGDRIGGRPVKTITPRAADKLYDKFLVGTGKKLEGGRQRLRTGEKLIGLCRKAWRVVHRLFPDEFDKDVPNPWTGVTLKVRAKTVKPAVTRDEVYAFAWGAIDKGYPEAAATAVICFEWLQRPENVAGGHMTWADYRAPSAPSTIRVVHHKTGTIAPHPLEEPTDEGLVRFYADAEEVLAKLPRLGVAMILRDAGDGQAKLWRYSSLNHVVARLRKGIDGVPTHFTLDACRHGGLTELEEAELTDGQGRALSTHKTQKAYEGYAKRTAKRMLSATRKRHAHVLANEAATNVQNEQQNGVQNENRRAGKNS